MKAFMDNHFLLETPAAQRLYHEAAALEPIFDYHCHLDPREIAENRRFETLTEIWLTGDHYKWRAMRAHGIDEVYITGNADPYEKLLAWAKTVPFLIGNPLYHWTHLELQRFFDFYEPFNEASAPEVWRLANEKLQKDPDFSVYGIFKKFNVFAVGTTDDPVDLLEHHQKIAKDGQTSTRVLPSYRPDRALDLAGADWPSYIALLGKRLSRTIHSFEDFLQAMTATVDYFDKQGCVISDHAFQTPPASLGEKKDAWQKEAASLFAKRMTGAAVARHEAEIFQSFVLCFLAGEYKRRNWVMQLHLAPLRSINTTKSKLLGPNTGFDVMTDEPVAGHLARLLDAMEAEDALPKTVLYSLNPKDNWTLAAIGGSFQGQVPGKMQLGSAWWFLDNRLEMERQMRTLANVGILPHFVGMLTDSRSFLSYPRHEYFRRIMCNLIGHWAEKGEIAPDFDFLAGIVKAISFRNAKNYFVR